MKLKRLRSDDELNEFRDIADTLIGVSYPIEYLKCSRVYALVEEHKLCAGFAFVSRVPLRTVRSLPASSILPHKLTEITGIWMDPEVKSRSLIAKFWLGMCACAAPEIGRTLIFTYSSSKSGLRKMYEMFSPQEIYNGPVAALEGMHGDDVESINLLPAHKLALFPLINPGFFLKKILNHEQTRRFNGVRSLQIFKFGR